MISYFRKIYGVMLIFIMLILILTRGRDRPAFASTIFYETNYLGYGYWEYIYHVYNDSLTLPLEEFTIYFQYGLYDNLSVPTPVTGWSELVWNPALILGTPDPGGYDALAISSGIAQGSYLDGFSVKFEWLGIGTPWIWQPFEILDQETLDVLDSGKAAPELISSYVIPFQSGFNLISFPLYPLTDESGDLKEIGLEQLVREIPECELITYWDAESSEWVIVMDGWSSSPDAAAEKINPCKGYFVKVRKDTSYKIWGCERKEALQSDYFEPGLNLVSLFDYNMPDLGDILEMIPECELISYWKAESCEWVIVRDGWSSSPGAEAEKINPSKGYFVKIKERFR